jgi:hypothetical protein
MTPALTGGCQCGQVRYRSTGEPLGLYVCHCRECRRQSASAFGLSLQVPAGGFSVTSGAPRVWTRPTGSGRRLDCHFCPTCGSRLWHQTVGDAATLTIKAGSLDEPVDLSVATHIWVRSRMPGVEIPAGARCFSQEPD